MTAHERRAGEREPRIGEAAWIKCDGWAGCYSLKCIVVGHTAKRVRVELQEAGRLPGRNRWGFIGDVLLVPPYALRVLP